MEIQKFNQVEANIFSFLASKNFTEILKKSDIETEDYNVILLAHLMALGYNTTGISDGGAYLSYSQRLGSEREDFFRPHSGFHFYTTANRLIEDSSRCSNSTISLKNELFSTKNTRCFRDFCIEYYNKYSKKLPGDFFKKNKEKYSEVRFNFKLKKLKRLTEEGQKNGYNEIIFSNKMVKSYVESFYFNSILENQLIQHKVGRNKI